MADVVAALVAERFDERAAARLCASFYTGDPGFEAARSVSHRLKTLESLLTMRQELAARAGRPAVVPRLSGVSAEAFRHDHYAANAPAVLIDACRRWPSRTRWTVGAVLGALGKTDLEVLSDRVPASAPLGDDAGGPHRWRVPLADWLEELQGLPVDLRHGLVHDRDVLSAPAGVDMLDDLETDERYLTPEPAPREIALCIGVTGARSPLYQEDQNELVVVATGRLAVSLVSPLETHCLYATGSFSPVDLAEPDTRRYPRTAQMEVVDVVVYAGETLFVPVGWWHQLEAMESTTALSLRNLALPNQFELFRPIHRGERTG